MTDPHAELLAALREESAALVAGDHARYAKALSVRRHLTRLLQQMSGEPSAGPARTRYAQDPGS